MTGIRTLDTWSRLSLLALAAGAVSLYWTIVPGLLKDLWNDPNFSHGLLVPIFSAYLLWQRRSELRALPPEESGLSGLALILPGVLAVILGKAGGEYFTMRVSMVFLFAGVFQILFGWSAFRKCLFPIAFLVFMVPIPYILYDAAAFPLKMLASWVGEHSLSAIGIPVLRDGNIIFLPNMQLEVADACSGIRSLVSLIAFAAAASYFLDIGPGRGAIVAAAAVPVAVVTNSSRILLTGVLSYHFGQRAAEGFLHDFSGWVIFLAGALILFALGFLLRRMRKA